MLSSLKDILNKVSSHICNSFMLCGSDDELFKMHLSIEGLP
jgi:hypothetical protein